MSALLRIAMSLKRKTTGNSAMDVPKRPKKDFFSRPVKDTASAPSSISFQFKSKASNACIRLTTWNVNGIMSVDEKILKRYLEAEDPDVMILTRTKYSKDGRPNILSLKTKYKYQYWGTDPRPGYAGTAILSKFKPLKATVGLPSRESESKGRYVELEFENSFVIGTYAPNAGADLKNLEFKHQWNFALKQRLEGLDPNKPIIWGGDFNCIMSKQDIDSTALRFWNQMPGLLEEERKGLSDILCREGSDKPTLVDIWRDRHPTDEEYTHSSARYGSWRLDSFITSGALLEKAAACVIRHELKDLKLSDHWPVTLDIEMDMQPKASSFEPGSSSQKIPLLLLIKYIWWSRVCTSSRYPST